MLKRSTFSLRFRLISLSALTMLPLIGFVWHDAQRQYRRESAALEQEVRRLTAFIAGEVEQLFEGTRLFLATAVLASTRTAPSERAQLFAALAAQSPYYAGVGIFDGQDPAAGAPAPARPPPPAAELPNRARETGQLVVGRLDLAADDGHRPLTLSYDVADPGPGLAPVTAYVVMNPDWLDVLLSKGRITGQRSLFPSNMVLNVLDQTGTILTRYPSHAQYTGKKLPETDMLAAILQRGEGAAELTGVSGTRRFFAFQALRNAGSDIVVSVGLSRVTMLAAARRDLITGIAGVILVGLLLIGVAWVLVGRQVAQPVAELVATTQQLGAGALSARAELRGGVREFHHLAEAFNQMAERLQRDEDERRRVQGRLLEYERQLRSAALRATLAEEHERKQIAAGLHDRVGPLLATCFMKLGRALKPGDAQRQTAAIQEGRLLVEQAIADIRSLTFDLSSPTLYTLGLVPAVQALCQETAAHHALAIEFRDEGTPAVGVDGLVVLYRAARELLYNVVTHARATRAEVVCGGDAEEAFIAVSDNGVGFDPANAGQDFDRAGGFGLFNLRERVTQLGGRIAVESAPGRGTRIVVRLPAGAQDDATGDERGDSDISGG